jgi:hypothetical protein
LFYCYVDNAVVATLGARERLLLQI